MTKIRSLMVWLSLLTASGLSTAFAQSGGSYNLSWSTIDAGGGAGAGGTFVVRATVGQPDAWVANGGSSTLFGGFWAPDSIDPVLRIERSGGFVIIAWPADFAELSLQEAADLKTLRWSAVGTAP